MPPLSEHTKLVLHTLCHKPQRVKGIATKTGLTQNQVSTYLKRLSARGMALPTSSGWIRDG